jgi:hypothetical protein
LLITHRPQQNGFSSRAKPKSARGHHPSAPLAGEFTISSLILSRRRDAAGKKETQKIRSRSMSPTTTFLDSDPAMTQRLLLTCLLAALLTTTGCSLFRRKSDQPKDNGAISGEVEESFRRRWVERRAAELTTQGVAAETARTQAAQEFRDKFEYTRAGGKK